MHGWKDLLSNMYKLFRNIITSRLEKKLDENQPRTGYRSKYSTTDHTHAINQLKVKCREYMRAPFTLVVSG